MLVLPLLLALQLTGTAQAAPRLQADAAPESAYYQFLLARHAESEGDIDGAIEAYHRAAELDPKSADIPADLAALFVRLNRPREAIEAGEAALAIDPAQRDAHRVLGLAYAAQGQGAGSSGRPQLLKAIDHLERAQSGTAQDPSIDRALARLYLKTDQPDKAIARLTDAVTSDPEDSEGVYLLVQAYSATGRGREALPLVEKLAETDPQYYRVLAELYERDQRWADAATAYGKASANNPRSQELRMRWATALLNSPDEASAKRATEILRKVVEATPTEPRSLYLLSQAERRTKDYAGAEATARRILIIDPKSLWGPLALSQVFEDQKEYQRVIEALEPYAAEWLSSREDVDRPDVARLLAHLGFAYQETHRPDRAVVSLQAATRFSTDASMPFQLGAILERQKKYPDAERAFLQALDRDPQHAPSLNYLGYMLAERGERLGDSVKYIRRALDVEPDNPSYLDSLGWAYYKADKLDEAEAPLKRASELLPTNRTVQDHWGDLLFKLGRFRDAISAWEMAIAGEGDEDVPRSVLEGKIKTAREKAK